MSEKRIIILNSLLNQVEESIPYHKKTNITFSKSSVAWQLDHALKVINGVAGILIKTDPEKYKKEFNLTRTILFPLCYIPRGKAKAPKIVMPPDIITEEGLISQLQDAKIQIEKTKLLPETSHFIHHVFGMLSKQQTLRFLQIHTKHHLKIVNDILSK